MVFELSGDREHITVKPAICSTCLRATYDLPGLPFSLLKLCRQNSGWLTSREATSIERPLAAGQTTSFSSHRRVANVRSPYKKRTSIP